MEQRRSPLLSSSFAFPFLFFLEDEGNLLQNSSFYPLLPPSVRPLAFTGLFYGITHFSPCLNRAGCQQADMGWARICPGESKRLAFLHMQRISNPSVLPIFSSRVGATGRATEWRWRCTLNGRKWGISRCMERRFPTSLFSSEGKGRDGGSRLIHVCGYKNAKGKGESEGACI